MSSQSSRTTYLPWVAATISSDFLRLAGAGRGSQAPRTRSPPTRGLASPPGWLARGVGARPLRPGHFPPEASRSRHAAGAGGGSQAPRTRSHRLTHQPDGPLAATHRARNPVMPRRPHSRHSRRLSPLTTGLPKNPLPPGSFRIVAPFGKRSYLSDHIFSYITQILCL
jgi:hypothetical protein